MRCALSTSKLTEGGTVSRLISLIRDFHARTHLNSSNFFKSTAQSCWCTLLREADAGSDALVIIIVETKKCTPRPALSF